MAQSRSPRLTDVVFEDVNGDRAGLAPRHFDVDYGFTAADAETAICEFEEDARRQGAGWGNQSAQPSLIITRACRNSAVIEKRNRFLIYRTRCKTPPSTQCAKPPLLLVELICSLTVLSITPLVSK